MRRVYWTESARHALQESKTYLERQRRGTADKISGDIFKAGKANALIPLAGRVETTGLVHVWSLPKWHKMIIYRIEADDIQIIAFRDTRQETPRS